jgi:hypothetical protein
MKSQKKVKHECSWDSVEWELMDGVPYYRIGGLGETLERNGVCKICGKNLREVYLQSCIIDSDNEVEMDLT